jgi:hypothetical protein
MELKMAALEHQIVISKDIHEIIKASILKLIPEDAVLTHEEKGELLFIHCMLDPHGPVASEIIKVLSIINPKEFSYGRFNRLEEKSPLPQILVVDLFEKIEENFRQPQQLIESLKKLLRSYSTSVLEEELANGELPEFIPAGLLNLILGEESYKAFRHELGEEYWAINNTHPEDAWFGGINSDQYLMLRPMVRLLTNRTIPLMGKLQTASEEEQYPDGRYAKLTEKYTRDMWERQQAALRVARTLNWNEVEESFKARYRKSQGRPLARLRFVAQLWLQCEPPEEGESFSIVPEAVVKSVLKAKDMRDVGEDLEARLTKAGLIGTGNDQITIKEIRDTLADMGIDRFRHMQHIIMDALEADQA